MVSNAQKRATKKYMEKLYADPEKKEELLTKARLTQQRQRDRIKENSEKHQEQKAKSRERYVKWKDNAIKNNPEQYKQYLFRCRVRHWNKIKETKSPAEFDLLMVKLQRNRPDFHRQLHEYWGNADN